MKIIKLHSPWWRRLGLLTLAAASVFIMMLMATYLYLAPLLPRAEQLRSVDYQIPLRIYSSDNLLIGEARSVGRRLNSISFLQLL